MVLAGRRSTNHTNSEELFDVVPDGDVLASIPTKTRMAIPTPQELLEVLEDFHRLGLEAASLGDTAA